MNQMIQRNHSKAPVLFVGHGSPMNAIANNSFTQTLGNLGALCPHPKAILCISAHWMTEGTWITHMSRPKTIHDFYGFPKELGSIQYPASGDPDLAEFVSSMIESPKILLDDTAWGLDHGSWSILRHLYPDADVPTIQLSLDLKQKFEHHFKLGSKLKSLREQNILIIGSGNIVHNLQQIQWNTEAKPYDWAVDFDEWVKSKLIERDFDALVHDYLNRSSGPLSAPTAEHYLPMLYVLGASDSEDILNFDFEGFQNASISMRTFRMGAHSV